MTAKLKDALDGSVTQSAIATACNVSQQAVSLWINQGKVPAKRAKRFHEATGIPLHIVNPDIFETGEVNG